MVTGDYRVLLVRPPFDGMKRCDYPPFGLLTIASYLQAKGIKVTLCDLAAGDRLEDLDWSFTLVGISVFSSQLRAANVVAQHVRLQNTKHNADGVSAGGFTSVVAGGAGVTSNPLYAAKMLPDCNVIFAGDGERFAEEVEGFFFPASVEQMIVDRRGLPFLWSNPLLPAWGLVDAKRYAGSVGLAIETSRGCPHGCSMCTAQMIHGRRYRARNPKDIVADMVALNRRYGAKRFYFTDDNATVQYDRWELLMSLISAEDRGFVLSVPEGIQAHSLDLHILSLMKEAGFQSIFIGVESGNQRVLTDVVGKGNLRLEQVERVVVDCRKIGLTVSCFFVVGLVGESLMEAKETVVFAQHLRDLGAYSCLVRNAIPIPGTKMYEQAVAGKLLLVSDEQLNCVDFVHSGKHLLKGEDWQPSDIESLVAIAKAQDAKHILQNNKGYLVKRGVSRLSHPIAAFNRFAQLRREAKLCKA